MYFQLFYSSQKFRLFMKILLLLFFPKIFVLINHPYLPLLYTIIDIFINTPTTMKNQFEALNELKTNIFISVFLFLIHINNFPFHFFCYFILKSQLFYFKFYKLIKSYSSSCFLVKNEWVTFINKLCAFGEAKYEPHRI